MDFSSRQKVMRGAETSKFYDMEEEKREKAKGGLDEREYWLTKVYDEESALKFY